ncbi:MAG: hypothetical protein M3Y65_15820 [Pseudomonadota bacterium]|nr:hypothetical protein [Pseudomonadota bacterium]
MSNPTSYSIIAAWMLASLASVAGAAPATQALTAASPATANAKAKAKAPAAPTATNTATAMTTATATAHPAQGKQDVSPAEMLLFQTNHLQNLQAPATVRYTFHKEGSAEPGFDDQVRLVLAQGTTSATLEFLSGPRQYTAPPVDNPEGNPVLLGFLERDIAEMQRLTGGARNHFRQQIRLALAEAAQVRASRFSYAGKTVDGSEIVIQPYRTDPMRARFEQYADKRYAFVVSPQVPGGVYQVRAAVVGAKNTPVLLEETLTLAGVDQGRN